MIRQPLKVRLLLSKLLLELQELLLLALPNGPIFGRFLSALEGIPARSKRRTAPSLAKPAVLLMPGATGRRLELSIGNVA
jgi:hypothetical protein